MTTAEQDETVERTNKLIESVRDVEDSALEAVRKLLEPVNRSVPRCELGRRASPQDHRLGVQDDRTDGGGIDPADRRDREGDQQRTQLHGRFAQVGNPCLLYKSPSPRDRTRSRMPS